MQGVFLQERTARAARGEGAARPLAVAGIAAPLAAYSHGVEVAPGARLVFCSGQLGQDEGGGVPQDCAAQAELCFRNVEAILASAGMSLADVVRINAFVTAREHMAPYMRVRDRLFTGSPPASTLMIVGGFTREEFVVEVEVVAAALAGAGEGR